MQLFVDHKKILPALYNVAVDQLVPHITTEVECEYLFSQEGHLYYPIHFSTKTKTFELLLIAEHRMHRIYCCPNKVNTIYLHIMKDKTRYGKLERDDRIVLDLEKKIYLDMFPHNEGVFENYGSNEAVL